LEDLTLEYVKKDESALYSKALLQNMWQNKEFMDCAIEVIFRIIIGSLVIRYRYMEYQMIFYVFCNTHIFSHILTLYLKLSFIYYFI